MHKISIIIPTYNEEKNLSELLPELSWADEIIVVDSYSNDNTKELVKKFDIRFLQREYKGPSDQKNWTIPQAKYQWILILDADERPTTSLRKEIQDLLRQDKIQEDSYWIRRKNYFMGREVKYSGWQGDKVIRFFNRDLCQYNDKQVHEEITTKGTTGKLTGKIEHYTYQNLSHFSAKMERYAKWSATDYYKKTSKVSFFHLTIKPFFRFFKHFILRLGFLDGRRGFIISSYMAWGVFLRYSKIHEIHLNEQLKKGKKSKKKKVGKS